MKIIDFERKGNVVRFFLGADDCFDYWGDDWDDAPYDYNAGQVYDRYVTGHKDVYYAFDSLDLQPESNRYNSRCTKEDMKKRKIPCIIVVPKEIHEDTWNDSFSQFVGADGILRFYFGDPMEPDENT